MQYAFHRLAVIHSRMGHPVAPNEFVLLVEIHMILLAIVIVPRLDCPAGVGIFLPPFGWVLLPFGGILPSFKHGVLLACIPLLRHGDQRGINEFASLRLKALVGHIGVKLFKQNFGSARLPRGFPKQPDRFCRKNVLVQIEAEESDKRQAISDRLFHLVIG